jgi:nucleosome binding factor SPN SPT16 subunit
LTKENPTGPFADEWKKAFDEAAKDLESVDVALALSAAAMAVKDEKELVSIISIKSESTG